MAESTLTLTYAMIQGEVSRFLGWDTTATNWTTAQSADFEDILRKGQIRFYYPPPPAAGQPRFEWDFLHLNGTTDTANATTTAAIAYENFSGVIEDEGVTVSSSQVPRLKKCEEWEIRQLITKEAGTGTPKYYAIRQLTSAGVDNFTSATGQRWEFLLYPIPDGTHTLLYRYVAVPDMITSVNIHFRGGGQHSETMLEAILSVAEERMDDDGEGVHFQRFLMLLGASARIDTEQKANLEGKIL